MQVEKSIVLLYKTDFFANVNWIKEEEHITLVCGKYAYLRHIYFTVYCKNAFLYSLYILYLKYAIK